MRPIGVERGGGEALATVKIAAADERRLSLARAAYDIIANEGFERLRTRDVAERIGINVATLHYYFPTKEALIEGVAFYLASQFQNVRAPMAAKIGGSALARLRQEFADHEYYVDARSEMITVMQELTLRAQRDPAIRRVIDPLKQAWRANIEALIAAGINEGIFRADLEPAAAAAVIVTAFWGTATLPLESGARAHVYRAIEEWMLPQSTMTPR